MFNRVFSAGIGIMMIGIMGVAGAIESDYGLKTSIIIMAAGIVLIATGLIKDKVDENIKEYKDYLYYKRIHSRNDASYPACLRR